MSVFSLEDPYRVSYIIVDRILAQSLSVVALVGITYLVVRELPEILLIIEDLLFVVTGSEYDLGSALDVPAAGAEPVSERPSGD
jgi:archaeosortase A (PGF-CTERM-specific)